MKKTVLLINGIFLFVILGTVFRLENFGILKHYLREVENVDASFIEQIKASRSIQQRDAVKLTYDGHALPYLDEKSNTVLFSKQLIDHITIDANTDVTVVKSFFDADQYIEIVAYTDSVYQTQTIQLTSLAVMDITCVSSDYDSDKYTSATVVLFDTENQKVIDSYAEIKIRGQSSRAYEKKSYTIKVLEDFSSRYSAKQPLNLRANSKYALDSIYEDDSKIRDMLSLELWKKYGAQSNPYGIDNSLSRAYVEVFINGEYRGLYGLQEVVDETNLSVDPFEQAAIFKINTHSDFTSFYPNAVLSELGNGDIEAVYSNLSGQKWNNLLSLFNSLESGEFQDVLDNYIYTNNYIDYNILLQFACAWDNTWKNLVLTQRNRGNSSMFLITPWDFDITFGARWDAYAERNVLLDSSITTQSELNLFNIQEMNNGDMQKKIGKRWFVLRQDVFQEDKLLNLANGYYDLITDSGARKRDAERWPNSAISQDNSFIEQFIKERLSHLDDFYRNYL